MDEVALLAVQEEEEQEEPFLGIFRGRGTRSAGQFTAALLVDMVPALLLMLYSVWPEVTESARACRY